jgi:hypothetical protein
MKTFMNGYANWEMEEGFVSDQLNEEDENWYDVMCRYAWSIYNNDLADRVIDFCNDCDLDADDFMKTYLMYEFLSNNKENHHDYFDLTRREINNVEYFISEY